MSNNNNSCEERVGVEDEGGGQSKNSLLEESKSPNHVKGGRRGGFWAKIRFFAAMTSTLTFIFSAFSLLFVFPILIDPIILGLDAKFISEPTECRTLYLSNGTGPLACELPSCREGCTADLYTCTFIHVQYTPINRNSHKNQNSSKILKKFSSSDLSSNSTSTSSSIRDSKTQNSSNINVVGVLYVNILGCGYPPGVSCSDFYDKFGVEDATYPCQYSQTNTSIVVPRYDRDLEIRDLVTYLGLTCGLMLGSALLLASILSLNVDILWRKILLLLTRLTSRISRIRRRGSLQKKSPLILYGEKSTRKKRRKKSYQTTPHLPPIGGSVVYPIIMSQEDLNKMDHTNHTQTMSNPIIFKSRTSSSNYKRDSEGEDLRENGGFDFTRTNSQEEKIEDSSAGNSNPPPPRPNNGILKNSTSFRTPPLQD